MEPQNPTVSDDPPTTDEPSNPDDPAGAATIRLGDRDVERINEDALRIDDLFVSFYDGDLLGMDEISVERLGKRRIGIEVRSDEQTYTVIVESDPRNG